MYSWVTFQHLLDWTQGELIGSPLLTTPVKNISTDTRTLKTGDVFIALKGENFDANQFLDKAAHASLIISEIKGPASVPTLLVKDGFQALVKISREIRKQFKGKVIAVTGSAGKSSTKEMIATLLGAETVKSPASFNNLLGVSKTMFLVEDSTQFLILEMGMNALNEIKELCENFDPQAVLITNIGSAHIGKLGGQEGIFRAKKEIFDYIAKKKEDRIGVCVNQSDPLVVRAYQEAFLDSIQTIFYSNAKGQINNQNGFLELDIPIYGEKTKMEIPIFGVHQSENISAAVAMATLLKVPIEKIKERLKLIQPAKHRGEVKILKNKKILIDESYNSNPTALESALSTLSQLDPQLRRGLIIGEMKELGEFSKKLHYEIGEKIVSLFQNNKPPTLFIGVGAETKNTLLAIQEKSNEIPTLYFSTVEELLSQFKDLLPKMDVLFIKGSRGIYLDKLVDSLI